MCGRHRIARGSGFSSPPTDPAHSLHRFLGRRGMIPVDLTLPYEIDAAESLRRFKQEHGADLQEIALSGTFLAEDEVKALFDLSLPGLDELMAFSRTGRPCRGR